MQKHPLQNNNLTIAFWRRSNEQQSFVMFNVRNKHIYIYISFWACFFVNRDVQRYE